MVINKNDINSIMKENVQPHCYDNNLLNKLIIGENFPLPLNEHGWSLEEVRIWFWFLSMKHVLGPKLIKDWVDCKNSYHSNESFSIETQNELKNMLQEYTDFYGVKKILKWIEVDLSLCPDNRGIELQLNDLLLREN